MPPSRRSCSPQNREDNDTRRRHRSSIPRTKRANARIWTQVRKVEEISTWPSCCVIFETRTLARRLDLVADYESAEPNRIAWLRRNDSRCYRGHVAITMARKGIDLIVTWIDRLASAFISNFVRFATFLRLRIPDTRDKYIPGTCRYSLGRQQWMKISFFLSVFAQVYPTIVT